ncbi:serine hydrolase domain-containing protein [Paenibacillus arenosi]|uniref:Beta-lactamase family protein n=1 Tax=Paenibacillus arenosi TaxID=2774142 RepID=A0ABR9ARZ4_9BACL|nr:serine hydrolase domain-containing protein [Paenibacillus arenosi]MBD8496884.1 beta-lactamase family protein [Paenibacillus arenosi]
MKHNGFTTKDIDDFLAQLVPEDSPACLSVALWKHNRIAYRYIKGTYASVRSWRDITPSTPFNIGSITKVITSLIMLRMQERQLLSLQDKIVDYLPSFPHDDVTIEQLMTHTAGYETIRIILWPKWNESMEEFAAQLVPLLERKYEPGTKTIYFPHSHFFLMQIIEKVSGQRIERLAHRELFQPLKMKHTTYDTRRLKPRTYVLPCTPYLEEGDVRYDRLRITGDSNLYSTAYDLLKLAEALLNAYGKSPLSRSLIEQSLYNKQHKHDPHNSVFFQKGAGNLVSFFSPSHSSAAVGHLGFTGCMFWIDPEQQMAGTIVSNMPTLNDAAVYASLNEVLLHWKE